MTAVQKKKKKKFLHGEGHGIVSHTNSKEPAGEQSGWDSWCKRQFSFDKTSIKFTNTVHKNFTGFVVSTYIMYISKFLICIRIPGIKKFILLLLWFYIFQLFNKHFLNNDYGSHSLLGATYWSKSTIKLFWYKLKWIHRIFSLFRTYSLTSYSNFMSITLYRRGLLLSPFLFQTYSTGQSLPIHSHQGGRTRISAQIPNTPPTSTSPQAEVPSWQRLSDKQTFVTWVWGPIYLTSY